MEKIEQIRVRLAAGEAPASIAEAVGLSLRRVYQVRGGGKRNTPSAEQIEAMKSAARGGKSLREISKEFGLNRATVKRHVGDAPLEILREKPGKLSQEDITHILARSAAGRSASTIAKEMEKSRSVVAGVIERRAKVRDGDDIMRAVSDEMQRRGLTAHGLSQLVAPPPTREMLYEYLRGASSPSTVVASRILTALGGRVVF